MVLLRSGRKEEGNLRVRLLDSRVTKEGVYYRLTSEAIEFYLDTKEIQDESDISVSQVLLSKMIASRNFREESRWYRE